MTRLGISLSYAAMVFGLAALTQVGSIKPVLAQNNDCYYFPSADYCNDAAKKSMKKHHVRKHPAKTTAKGQTSGL